MPIRNCPIKDPTGRKRLRLPIVIVNPDTGITHKTHALIDTGASKCVMPGEIAKKLGHNVEKGLAADPMITGNGSSKAYGHTTSIKVFHPTKSTQEIYSFDRVVVDTLPELKVFLLGVKDFLDYFELNVNYPKEIFSLIHQEE